MPKPENLIGHRWGKDKPAPSSDEASVNGRKGGLARAAKQRELKSAVEIIKMFLQKEIKGTDGNQYNYKEAGLLKLVQKFVGGDAKATELVLKMIGEMPADKAEITNGDGSGWTPPIINILPVTTKNGKS